MPLSLRNTCVLMAVCLAVSFCTSRVVAQAAEGDGAPASQAKSPYALRFQKLDNHYYEIGFIAFMLAYIVNIVVGRAQNEHLAIYWTSEMVKNGGVLDRNFTLIGPGDTKQGEVLLKESMHEFKLWASGRRYCQGFLATFILKKRQDVLGLTLDLLAGSNDILEVEIAMNESSLPPIVLAIAPPSLARQLARNMSDVETYTRKLEVDRSRLAGWPQKGLSVLGEHSSIFYDLMTPHLMELLFGPTAWAHSQKLFRSLHITSEYPGGSHKQVIRLSFYLPPKGDTEALHRLLTLSTLLIDILGTYKLTPDQTKRAQEARAKAAKGKDGDREAKEELQLRLEERRNRKLAEEKEKLKRMTPEQRERYEEKKRKKQFQSRFRIKAV